MSTDERLALETIFAIGFAREDVVALFHFLDGLIQPWWRALKVEKEARKEGLQQGLHSERHLMLRQVRRRFGETVATDSAPWRAQIAEPAVLEDLGEALLDCADGAAWLTVVAEKAGER